MGHVLTRHTQSHEAICAQPLQKICLLPLVACHLAPPLSQRSLFLWQPMHFFKNDKNKETEQRNPEYQAVGGCKEISVVHFLKCRMSFLAALELAVISDEGQQSCLSDTCSSAS